MTLAVFATLALSEQASASIAYLGVVGTGGGAGILGHTFLLFKEPSQPFLLGYAYQYNLSKKNGTSIHRVHELAQSQNIVFSLKKQPFIDMQSAYTDDENRIIAIYELALSSTEVVHLQTLLKADLENPSFSEQHPYGYFNNCVTRPIELINQVVSPERRIAYQGSEKVWSRAGAPLADNVRAAILNRLPFFIALTLERHPISKGRVELYETRQTTLARFVSALRADIEQITRICHWTPPTKKALDAYIQLYVTQPDRYAFDPVLNLLRSCPSAQPLYAGIISTLFQLVDEKHVDGRAKLHELANELVWR